MEHRLLTDLVAAADHLTIHFLSERKVTNFDHTTCPSFQRLLARKSPEFVDDPAIYPCDDSFEPAATIPTELVELPKVPSRDLD